jgi:hypothetical protein
VIPERQVVVVTSKADDPPKADWIPKATPQPPKGKESFAGVLDAVGAVENRAERVVLLIRVAQARAASGDTAGAKKDLQQALDLTDGLDGDTPRGLALREIAQTRLRIGDVADALAIAEKFKVAFHRNHLLFLLAGQQATAGDLRGR